TFRGLLSRMRGQRACRVSEPHRASKRAERVDNLVHYGGWVDLVAIAPDGALILIEIKRDRTPREVSEPMRHGDQPPKKAQHRTSKVHR
ncbi:MAG: hypothetical protein WBW08_01930, partial [Methyloceanibacter sp.]